MEKSTIIQGVAIKSIYFFAFAAFASWMTYFYVYLKEVPALTGIEIGIIAAIQQVNTILFVPLWGVFADRFGRRKMLMLAIFVSSLLLLVLWGQTSFLTLIIWIIVLTFFFNPLNTLMDSIALDFEEQHKTSSYGEMRLWASVGWAIGSFSTGFVIGSDNLFFIFPIASTILFLTGLIVKFVYKPITVIHGIKPVRYTDIINILKNNTSLLLFLILIFVYSIFTAPVQLFINLYYNEIGASNKQIGIAFAVQSLSELPFFFYGKRIINKFGSKNTLIFSMIVTAIRMVGYGIFPNPIIAISIGVLQGICLALFFVSIVDYVQKNVQSQFRSIGQSMIYTFFGAGMCIGNLLTGYLKDVISVQTTMILNASFISLIIIFVILAQNKKMQRLKKWGK